MYSLYGGVLLYGAAAASEIFGKVSSIFEEQCLHAPLPITPAEITLAGHANLFSCCAFPDFTSHFRDRLPLAETHRNSELTQWHFAKALAAVALEMPITYRPMAGFWPSEEVSFSARALPGYNPQAMLAHLAGAVESRATIHDVWPAFEEFVFNFPRQEQAGVFDSSCLFWIARIVHHHIGGRPLGQTGEWLSRHFNAWADGRSLPPI